MYVSDESDDEPKQPTTMYGHRVGETVSYKLKTKIMANRYIQFSDLLPQHGIRRSDTDEYHLTMKHRAISFVKNRPVRNLTIFQWMESFDIFTSIYISNAPTKSKCVKLTADLLTYKRNILSYRQQGYNWQDLDRHYRQEQEIKPIAWSTVRQDLLFQYINQSAESTPNFRFKPIAKHSQQKQIRTADGTPLLVGFCAAFHSAGKMCTAGNSCKYQHSCPWCQARHPLFRPCGPIKPTPGSGS